MRSDALGNDDDGAGAGGAHAPSLPHTANCQLLTVELPMSGEQRRPDSLSDPQADRAGIPYAEPLGNPHRLLQRQDETPDFLAGKQRRPPRARADSHLHPHRAESAPIHGHVLNFVRHFLGHGHEVPGCVGLPQPYLGVEVPLHSATDQQMACSQL